MAQVKNPSPVFKKTLSSQTSERIGILLVHGVGEQRNFEHLESEAREILRAIRQKVNEDGKEARVTLQVLTTQDGVYLGERENWKAEGAAPVIIDINYADDQKNVERRDQSFEFREVWWADLDEPSSVTNAIGFWFWGLSLWARPMFVKPPKPNEKGGEPDSALPGHVLHMIHPGKDETVKKNQPGRPPRTTLATRVHLFLTATIFTLILATLLPVNWVLKRIGLFRIRPADILVRYLADVKLYQQAKRRDLWPLVDMGRPPRVMIRRRTIRAITDIALADYDRWYILAHSLGTVVACNALMETAHSLPNFLGKEQWQKVLKNENSLPLPLGGAQRPGIDEMNDDTEDMMPARPVWLEDNHVIYRDRLFAKFRGILTYGSPLDKFAALFPATVPLNKNAAVFAKGAEWINVHDMTDPVAGKLDYFNTPSKAHTPSPLLQNPITIEPVNYAYAAHWLLLYSHIRYLKFKPGRKDRLVNHVTEWLLTGNSFPIPQPGSPGWLEEPQVLRREIWRYFQDLLVVGIAAALLAWLFNPLLTEIFEKLAEFDNWFGDTIGDRLLAWHQDITASAQGLVNSTTSSLAVTEFILKAVLYVFVAALIAVLSGLIFQLFYRLKLVWLKVRKKMVSKSK